MTLQELFDLAGEYPQQIIFIFALLPIAAYILPQFSQDKSYNNPWKMIYSFLVYTACIPGVFAVTLTLYSFLFEQKSMLDVNLFVYFLPIVSMIITLMTLSNQLTIERIPGFDKLSGLIFIIAATFITLLVIQKTRIWVMFHGTMTSLVVIFIVLFIVFRVGWSRITRSRK